MLRDGVPYGVKQDESLGALGRTNGSLEIWNLASGALLTSYRGHQASVSVIAFSPKGRHLASGTTEGELKIWALDDWHQVTKLRFPSTDSYLSSAVFSPDGKTVAAGCLNGKVRLWQVPTGRLVLDLDTRDVVMSLSFSPGGKLLAATTMVANEVRIFQLPSGAEFASLKAHVMGIGAVAFCPDGKTLATGGFDGKVKLWNLKTLQEIVTFPLGTRVPVLQFSPDGRALAIGDLIGSSRQTHLLLAPSFSEISETETKQAQR